MAELERMGQIMTNMEKFMKVFHIDYVDQKAISACFLCPDDECKKTECHDCRYQKAWWDEEYGKEEDDG